MKTGILTIIVLFLTVIASANEPLWTEAERTRKRDVVIDGEVLSVKKLHEINKTEDLYIAKVKILKTHKSHGDLVPTISVHFEFPKTGKNTRCPTYAELKKGDKGKFFLTDCGIDLKKRLKLEKVNTVLFLEMGSDVLKKKRSPQNDVVFREPFTLKLHIDNERYYEESYTKKIPYVFKNDVYLFSGESFGIDTLIKDGDIAKISYQEDTKKADVWFKFTQEKRKDGKGFMMLVINSRLKHRLYMDAIMTIPGKEKIYKTSILPLEPGLSNYESWPHTIAQLVLRNFRLKEGTPNKELKATE